MDSARRVIKHLSNFRVLSQMESYVINQVLNPHLLHKMASYDVTRTINDSLIGGGAAEAVRSDAWVRAGRRARGNL